MLFDNHRDVFNGHLIIATYVLLEPGHYNAILPQPVIAITGGIPLFAGAIKKKGKNIYFFSDKTIVARTICFSNLTSIRKS